MLVGSASAAAAYVSPFAAAWAAGWSGWLWLLPVVPVAAAWLCRSVIVMLGAPNRSLVVLAAQRMVVGHEHSEIRIVAAECRVTTRQAFARLAHDSDPSVVRAVARNPSCPPSVLRLLMSDQYLWARDALSSNPRLPWQMGEVLWADESAAVRAGVVKRRRASRKHLVEGAHDPSPHVRLAVARHRRCPAEALDILASDTDPHVLEAVKAHRNTTVEAQAFAALAG